MKEIYPQELLDKLYGTDAHFKAPGDNAESIADVRARVFAVLDEILAKHQGQTVLLFAHGAVFASVFAAILLSRDFAADRHVRSFFVKNNAINVIQYMAKEGKWYISRLGDDDYSVLRKYEESQAELAALKAIVKDTSARGRLSIGSLVIGAFLGVSLCLALRGSRAGKKE